MFFAIKTIFSFYPINCRVLRIKPSGYAAIDKISEKDHHFGAALNCSLAFHGSIHLKESSVYEFIIDCVVLLS